MHIYSLMKTNSVYEQQYVMQRYYIYMLKLCIKLCFYSSTVFILRISNIVKNISKYQHNI